MQFGDGQVLPKTVGRGFVGLQGFVISVWDPYGQPQWGHCWLHAFVSFLLLSIHPVLPSAPQLIRRLGPSLCVPSPIPCPAPFQAGDGGEGGGGRGGQDLAETLVCNHVKLRVLLFALGALVLSYSCYLAAAHSWARREWSLPALPATNPSKLSTARGFRAAAFAH